MMNKECQAELFYEKTELNENNRRITVKESLGIVFASIKSAGRTEFYEAARSGYKAQKMLRLRSVDYNERSPSFCNYGFIDRRVRHASNHPEIVELSMARKLAKLLYSEYKKHYHLSGLDACHRYNIAVSCFNFSS